MVHGFLIEVASRCGTWALGLTVFSSHGTQAYLPCGIWNLPRPGMEPCNGRQRKAGAWGPSEHHPPPSPAPRPPVWGWEAAGRCAGHAKDLPRLSEQCSNKSAWHDSWQGFPRTLATPATAGDTPPSSHPSLPPSGPGLLQVGDSHLHGKEFCDSGLMQSSKWVCQT